jgi:tRNA A-37 threonylcarbamoyl transferase component Bud32
MASARTLLREGLARLAEELTPPAMTAEEQRLYRAQQDRIVLDRFRLGAPFGALACVLVAAVGSLGQPERAAWMVRIGGAAATVTALASIPISRAAWVRSRPNALFFSASLVAAAAAGLVAARTGGFESVATAAITLLWAFGAIVTPISPSQALVDAMGQLAVASIVIAAVAPVPGSPLMFGVLNAFGVAFLYVGLSLRERATVKAFLVQRSLDDANKALGTMNAELERRVDEQVAEIRKHAKDVEVLNAQLQQRVIERSRELAVALGRLERPAHLKSPPVGAVLNGRVELVRCIDSGGMGDVFEAFDSVTKTRVAVKTIHGRRLSDVSSLHRFLREARAASAVVHEGIVRTLDVDVTADGTLFHVMELLEGETLADWLSRTRERPVGGVVRIGRAIAEALAAAHSAGVVHRDVKPANVMLTRGPPPGVKLLDFGVSKLEVRAVGDGKTTESHFLLGTPAYMAPEQARDPASASYPADVYSLGAILYEALAGTLPHEGSSVSDYIRLHATVAPADLSVRRPELPAELARAVMHCLAADPASRPDARAVSTELAPFVDVPMALVSEPTSIDPRASTIATGDSSHERARRMT